MPIYEPWIATTQEENITACVRDNWISLRGCFIDTFENCLIAKLAEHNMECGTWFDFSRVAQSGWSLPDGWENMFSKYLNLPCHCTLTSEIEEAINEFAS